VRELTGRLFRAKTAPRPLFAPPHFYIDRVNFVYRVFSVMSIAFGEIATKLTEEEANRTGRGVAPSQTPPRPPMLKRMFFATKFPA